MSNELPCTKDCRFHFGIGDDACDYCSNESLRYEEPEYCPNCDAPVIDGKCVEGCDED